MTTPIPPEAVTAHEIPAETLEIVGRKIHAMFCGCGGPAASQDLDSAQDMLDAAAPLIVADFARRLLARTAGTILGDDLANVLEDMDGDPPVVHWLTGKVTTACGAGGSGASALVNTGLNSTIRGDVTCEACKQTTAWRT